MTIKKNIIKFSNKLYDLYSKDEGKDRFSNIFKIKKFYYDLTDKHNKTNTAFSYKDIKKMAYDLGINGEHFKNFAKAFIATHPEKVTPKKSKPTATKAAKPEDIPLIDQYHKRATRDLHRNLIDHYKSINYTPPPGEDIVNHAVKFSKAFKSLLEKNPPVQNATGKLTSKFGVKQARLAAREHGINGDHFVNFLQSKYRNPDKPIPVKSIPVKKVIKPLDPKVKQEKEQSVAQALMAD